MEPTSLEKPWYMATAKETCALLDVSSSKGLRSEQLKDRKSTKPKKPSNKVLTPKFGVLFWSLQVIAVVGSVGFLLLTNNVWFLIFTITAFIFILFGLAQQNYVEHIAVKFVKGQDFTIKVRRDGKKQTIKALELVVGDIVLIAPGDYIPADMRIIELKELAVDQRDITGEALPSVKNSFALYKKTKQINQKNMLFAGSYAVAGTAVAVVVSVPKVPEHLSVVIEKNRLNKAQKSRLLTIALLSSLLGALLLIASNNFIAIALLTIILVVSTYKYMEYWLRFTVWATLYEELYQKGIYFSSISELQKTFKADTVLVRVNEDTMEQAAFVHQLQAELLIEVRPLVAKKQVKELEEELNINDSALTAKDFLGLRRDKKLAKLREYQLLVGFDDIAIAESISLLTQAGHHVLWIDDEVIPGNEAVIASEYITLQAQPSAMALIKTSAKFNQPSLRKIANFFEATKRFKKITAY